MTKTDDEAAIAGEEHGLGVMRHRREEDSVPDEETLTPPARARPVERSS
jgi:hypothetical protein